MESMKFLENNKVEEEKTPMSTHEKWMKTARASLEAVVGGAITGVAAAYVIANIFDIPASDVPVTVIGGAASTWGVYLTTKLRAIWDN